MDKVNISHYDVYGKMTESRDGGIRWLNTYTGEFWFETRIDGRNIGFWGKTDYWKVEYMPAWIGKLIVREE